MSIKSKARSLGREIRKATGLSLPIAMRFGRMIAQWKPLDLDSKYVGITVHSCDSLCYDNGCNNNSSVFLFGKKGHYHF